MRGSRRGQSHLSSLRPLLSLLHAAAGLTGLLVVGAGCIALRGQYLPLITHGRLLDGSLEAAPRRLLDCSLEAAPRVPSPSRHAGECRTPAWAVQLMVQHTGWRRLLPEGVRCDQRAELLTDVHERTAVVDACTAAWRAKLYRAIAAPQACGCYVML